MGFMKTSYFARVRSSLVIQPEQLVSIARTCPEGFMGREYKKLAPSYALLQAYKSNGDTQRYIGAYRHEVLSELDPEEVYQELGEDSILLCWEGRDKFCHRHIVADWFHSTLGIEVVEL